MFWFRHHLVKGLVLRCQTALAALLHLAEELAALLDELLIGATLEELLDELLKELLEAGWLELIALLEDSAALLDAAGGGSWATQACKANSKPAAKTRE